MKALAPYAFVIAGIVFTGLTSPASCASVVLGAMAYAAFVKWDSSRSDTLGKKLELLEARLEVSISRDCNRDVELSSLMRKLHEVESTVDGVQTQVTEVVSKRRMGL